MAAGSDENGRGGELADALHQVLATLADLRTEMPVAELQERITLVHWLRGELAAVETLLTSAYGRRAAPTADPRRGPGAAG